MGYTSRRGRRPNEYASKSAHGHVIQDAHVQDFLAQCNLPKKGWCLTYVARLGGITTLSESKYDL